jgi:type VI protein secretion system component VasK
MVGSVQTDSSDSLNTPADVSKFFQPVYVVEPPGSDTWVVDKNAAYIEALALLRHSMQDIADGGRNIDPAVAQMASQNYDKALDAVRQIARGFKPVGVGGLDATMVRLLEEPIRPASRFITKPGDPITEAANKANRDLRVFCTSNKATLGKYPFRPSSTDDASLEEFAAIFQPATGAFWKFQQQSLAELTIKDGGLWKPKDPAKKPQLSQGMLDFLNRADSLASVFYPGGATRPQLSYTLRPRLDSRWAGFTLEMEIDGQPHQWVTSVQHQFSWPPPPGTKNAGAVVRLRTSTNGLIPVASQGGVWGILRAFGDAEPREPNARLVEWKYTRSGLGRKEPIDPPVNLEIVNFPGGQDVFNPKFWEGLRCPALAVDANK